MKKYRFLFITIILVIATVIVCLTALSIGQGDISIKKATAVLLGSCIYSIKGEPEQNQQERDIILKIRLPRVILGFIVGAGLSVVGVCFQSMLANPLADPYILGASSGAALGTSLVVAFGINSILLQPICAFLGALLAIIMVYLLAQHKRMLNVHTLLLSGVIVNSFLFALVIFLMSLIGRDSGQILMWLLGSLVTFQSDLIGIIGVITFAGIIILQINSWKLNLISIGEEKATSLGINSESTKLLLFVVSSIIVGAVVSISGLIGFVGLIVPHITRLILGPDNRKLIIGSMLIGGNFLVISDCIARTIVQPIELPIGVITALAGAPFFFYLLRRNR
ncbi:MAG: iron ABC transporter permease [bacterium]